MAAAQWPVNSVLCGFTFPCNSCNKQRHHPQRAIPDGST